MVASFAEPVLTTRIYLSLLSVGLVFITSTTSAKAEDTKQPLVAVYEPIVTPAARGQLERLKIDPVEVERQAEEVLRATRRFAIYERSTDVLKGAVMKEQSLAQSGLARGNAAELGKLDNVEYIVQPEITAVNIGSRYAPMEDFPGRFSRSDSSQLTVTFKLLDSTSGEIKFQTTQTVGSDRHVGVTDNRSGQLGAEIYPSLAHEVAVKGSNEIVNYIYPIQVIKISNRDIFLNRGEGGGISIGDVWEVESAGEDLIDPSSHENLGRSETPLGRVSIIRISPRFSVAMALGKVGGEIKPGDILRPISVGTK
jgi:hypothetical protein